MIGRLVRWCKPRDVERGGVRERATQEKSKQANMYEYQLSVTRIT